MHISGIIRAILVLTAVITFVNADSNEQCERVYEEQRFCLTPEDRRVHIVCPDRHIVSLSSAELTTTQQPEECAPTDMLNDDTRQMGAGACNTSTSVLPAVRAGYAATYSEISVQLELTDQCNYQAGAIVDVVYACAPRFGVNNKDIAFAVPMTRDYHFEGALVQVDSHYRALNQTYVNTIDTKCVVAVPPGTQLRLRMMFNVWSRSGVPNPVCTQRVVVTQHSVTPDTGTQLQEDQSWEFCNMYAPTVMVPCDDEEKHYTVTYVNDNPLIAGLFAFYLQVPHTVDMVVECGKPSDWTFDGEQFPSVEEADATTSEPADGTTDEDREPTPPPTATTDEDREPTPPPTATDGSGTLGHNDGDDDTNIVPIILGCLAVALLILVFVVLFVIIRYRRQPYNDKLSETSSESGSTGSLYKGAFIVHMDGEINHTLVIEKTRHSMAKLAQEKF